MTDKQYYACVGEAVNSTDCDAYTSDMALSTIWGDAPDAPIPPERLEALRGIYTAAHRTVREIIAAAGMTQAAFAEHLCIPRRTVEDWCCGRRECLPYIRLMMQEVLGLYTPPNKMEDREFLALFDDYRSIYCTEDEIENQLLTGSLPKDTEIYDMQAAMTAIEEVFCANKNAILALPSNDTCGAAGVISLHAEVEISGKNVGISADVWKSGDDDSFTLYARMDFSIIRDYSFPAWVTDPDVDPY